MYSLQFEYFRLTIAWNYDNFQNQLQIVRSNLYPPGLRFWKRFSSSEMSAIKGRISADFRGLFLSAAPLQWINKSSPIAQIGANRAVRCNLWRITRYTISICWRKWKSLVEIKESVCLCSYRGTEFSRPKSGRAARCIFRLIPDVVFRTWRGYVSATDRARVPSSTLKSVFRERQRAGNSVID